jgi:hypothetical protein
MAQEVRPGQYSGPGARAFLTPTDGTAYSSDAPSIDHEGYGRRRWQPGRSSGRGGRRPLIGYLVARSCASISMRCGRPPGAPFAPPRDALEACSWPSPAHHLTDGPFATPPMS